jgi:hypothetical protein
VRATLNDELLHEVGFESDYYAELERRREHRRRKLKVDLLRAVRAVAVVAVLLAAALPLLDIVRGAPVVLRAPNLVLLLTLLVGLVGWAADFLLDRMRGDGEPKGLLRRFFWRRYRAGVRAWKRAAHRLKSEA